ncbi:MAG: hypothetical protein U0939_06660 [Pirellulales bacterium]
MSRHRTRNRLARRLRRRAPQRRGVVLLIVLSLIILFTLIAVTYAIVAGQYKMHNRAFAKIQQVGDPPRKDLDMAMYQLLRDTTVRSSLNSHSLLRDLYGADQVRGRVTATSSVAGGQFIDLTVASVSGTFSIQSGHYNGCVFTFVTGAQRGHSTRVVGYDPNTSAFRIETQDNDGINVSLPAVGDEFVVNGRPFNGAGFGYQPPVVNTDQPGLTATVNVPGLGGGAGVSVPVALLPHFAGYSTSTAYQVDVGGADEPYDAVDFQNMPLAMVPPNAAASNEIMPSFHRQDLIAFWIKWLQANVYTSLSPLEMRIVFAYPYGPDNIPGNADDGVAPWSNVPLPQRQAIVDLKRRMIFRPLPEDHPNFNGGNPMFTMLGGVVFNSLDCDGDNRVDMWDVDNDGDGVPDSVWIDPGLPVATDKDGRPYKKLIAFLIRDMDGRININAMGALTQLNAAYTNDIPADGRVPDLTTMGRPMARGLGVGPADTYFGHLFGTMYATEFTNLLRGRYGADQNPGYSATDDSLSALKSLGIPNTYSTGPAAFGSPPDLSGQGAIALDHYGQPIFANMGGANETTDDPYESDPLRNRPEDAMYTAGELERLLRYNDADVAQLPQRLVQTAPNIFGNASNRQIITTHSSHIPVGPVTLPTELRTSTNAGVFSYLQQLQNSAGGGPSLLDLYRVRLTLGGIGNAQLNRQMQIMVPFEILHGQKFDVNRWFGNGRDDNGNGVVDEYEEAVAGELVWPNTAPSQFQNVNFSYYNDSPVGTDPRQVFARQLYCLVCVLMDSGYIDPYPTEGLAQPQRRELTYRRIAQWAINAVEFRDRDAVMTAFEYDINPWNGWICDGNLATNETTINYTSNGADDDGDGMTDEADEAGLGNDRRVVWGAEYPDLLLMETTAMHNRGVRDTDYDSNQRKILDSNMNRQDDIDQFRQPQGSLFFELYCPRNSVMNNISLPYELYDTTNGNLDLGRMAPARTFGMQQGRQPVWRVVIANQPAAGSVQQQAGNAPITTNFEPHLTGSDAQGLPLGLGLNMERIVWFAPSDPGNIPEANMIYYGRSGAMVNAAQPNLQATSNVLLPPSRYAVVGPRLSTIPSAAYQGADADSSTYEPGTETISLAGNTFNVTGYPNVYPTATPAMGAVIQRPLGIVCAAKPPQGWTNQNREIGINVSEPLPQSGIYYTEPNVANDARVPADAYADLSQPFDGVNNLVINTPFDVGGGPAAQRRQIMGGDVRTRTVNDHRSMFLQRLANPLAAWNPEPTDPVYGAYYDANLQVNPYITVDWTSVDLTVYSGEFRNTLEQVRQGMNLVMEWLDQDDQDPFQGAPPDERLCSRERGSRVVAGAVDRNFWRPVTTAPRQVSRVLVDRCFDYDFKHTLGYVNWTATDNPTVPFNGYEGSPDTTTEQPFPWLTWNNRPYANPLELMMVPASSPGRLCWEFGMATSGNRLYDATVANPMADTPREPFSHLLNFFMTSPTRTAGESPEYFRIFDYLETPSPFVGTEKWYNPATFANTGLTEPATFRPPYNRLSRFREPGRMNINTMFDLREWQAIAQGYHHYSTSNFFNTLVDSRRGYAAAPGTYGDWPTIFANPFRSAVSSDIAVNFGAVDMRKTGVEAGLLRPVPTSTVVNATQPLFHIPSGLRFEQTNRNPYFAYRGLNRLSNLVSYHSNVYAVWMTVGYFYVEPNPTGIDSGHPDGWRLGQEVGADLGTVERHRGFYLIDRSIPVGFEPGQNHNVDRCVLIRRFIE